MPVFSSPRPSRQGSPARATVERPSKPSPGSTSATRRRIELDPTSIAATRSALGSLIGYTWELWMERRKRGGRPPSGPYHPARVDRKWTRLLASFVRPLPRGTPMSVTLPKPPTISRPPLFGLTRASLGTGLVDQGYP